MSGTLLYNFIDLFGTTIEYASPPDLPVVSFCSLALNVFFLSHHYDLDHTSSLTVFCSPNPLQDISIIGDVTKLLTLKKNFSLPPSYLSYLSHI